MKIDLNDSRAWRAEIIDSETGEKIHHCISADDQTGEYEVYEFPVRELPDKTGFVTIKKIGKIEIRLREEDKKSIREKSPPTELTVGNLKRFFLENNVPDDFLIEADGIASKFRLEGDRLVIYSDDPYSGYCGC